MDKVKKIPTIVLWVIALISVLFMILFMIKLGSDQSDQMISLNLRWGYVLIAIASVLALVFALIQVFSDLKTAKNSLIYLGVIGVLFFIAYASSSSEIPTFFGSQKLVEDGAMTPTILRWVDAGLRITYYLTAIALLAISGFGISKLIKR